MMRLSSYITLIVLLLVSFGTASAALHNEQFSDSKVSFKVANHASSAVQVKLFHEGMHYRDLYIAPYYSSELTQVPEGLYTLEIYDTADNFMGYIEEAKLFNSYDNGGSLISVSRFNLKPMVTTKLAYPDITELASHVDIDKLVANLPKKAAEPKPEPAPVVSKIVVSPHRLKLANLTSYLIYVEIKDPEGKPLISPRFLANDAYSPEVIKEKDAVVVFPANATIAIKAFAATTKEAAASECLQSANCDQVLKKFEVQLSELKIDESDSYIWIIDELP